MNPVIRRFDKGNKKLDCVALSEAIRAGVLTDEDRRVAEQIFPGVCERLREAAVRQPPLVAQDGSDV